MSIGRFRTVTWKSGTIFSRIFSCLSEIESKPMANSFCKRNSISKSYDDESASSLCEFIKFGWLSEQLSNQEKRLFLMGLVNESPDLLMSSIFYLLYHKKDVDSMSSKVTKFNAEISDIMRARKQKQQQNILSQSTICAMNNKQTSKTDLNLCKLPNPIISKAASYLHQQDYMNLSVTSRKVFIGCNSPNSLPLIEFRHRCVSLYDGTYPFNFKLYPNVKHLSVDLGLREYNVAKIISNPEFMDQLESLSFDGSYGDRINGKCELDELPDVCESIKRLSLQWFYGDMSLTDYKQFVNVMRKFPNLEDLKLHALEGVKFDFIKDLLPNLKRLAIGGLNSLETSDKYEQLLYQYIDQLEELHVDQVDLKSSTADKMNCNRLKVLEISECNINTLDCLTRTAKNLKNVEMRWLHPILSGLGVRNAACNLITNCPSLTSIVWTMDGAERFGKEANERQMIQFLLGIKDGLNKTRHIETEYMYIQISIVRNAYDPFHLVAYVELLMAEIMESKIDNCMFLWGMYNQLDVEKICASVSVNVSSHKEIYHTDYQSWIIIKKNGSNFELNQSINGSDLF